MNLKNYLYFFFSIKLEIAAVTSAGTMNNNPGAAKAKAPYQGHPHTSKAPKKVPNS